MRNHAYILNRCVLFSAITGLFGTFGGSLTAQTTTTLPEITVLGEALADAQSKPVSASLLSAEDVIAFRIKEPQDIVRITPNMSATDSGSRSFGDVYSVRGLTNTVFFGAPATTIYVDDVPFGETFTYAQRLSAMNSVEVLRGPQPTVVGRNTYGGLINIRSKRPTNAFEGNLDYSYGSYESHTVDGLIMGPIAEDVLFFRLGGNFDSRQGFLKDPLTGDRLDDQQHWGINGGLFWKPAPGWEVSLTANYDAYDDGAPRLAALDRPDFYEVSTNVDGVQKRRVDSEALRVSYESEKWKFLSVTSRRYWDLDPYVIDLDFTRAPFGSSTIKQDQEIWSQEFRFSSNDPTEAFQWNIGAYGSTSKIEGSGLRNIFTQQQNITQFPLELPFPLPEPLNLTAISNSDISIEQLTTHSLNEDALAFYAGASWSGWKPFTFHAGTRVDWVRRSMKRSKSGVTSVDTVTTIQPLPPFVPVSPAPIPSQNVLEDNVADQSMEDEWVHVTPTLGIDWHLSDDVLLYAKTTYAFKPGGFSAYVDDPRFAAYGEERAWSSEAGIKTQWLDGKLTVNFAGFYNDIKDYQVERSINVTDYAVFNAASARTYGLEFETKYVICPQLDFYGSIGWTHARLTDYTDPVTGESLDGNTPPFVPEFDAAVALDFHLEAGFFARVEYLVLGNTKFDDFNRGEFQQERFGLVNAMLGWRAKHWTISFYGTNLAEEEYYTNMNTDVRTGAPGAPREFGVRVGLKF